jgi:hypothetical protein
VSWKCSPVSDELRELGSGLLCIAPMEPEAVAGVADALDRSKQLPSETFFQPSGSKSVKSSGLTGNPQNDKATAQLDELA